MGLIFALINSLSNTELSRLSSVLQESSNRFRKRDKALFYGRKMLRKVRSISGQVRATGQGRKRKMVMRFARRLLQLRRDNETEQLKVSLIRI